MKKNVLLISAIIILMICNFSFANALENLNFVSPENREYNIHMEGYFSKSGIVSPNEPLYIYNSGHNKLLIGLIENFTFTGRTGDKTFDITYTSSDLRPSTPPIRETKREKINLFFEKDSICPLAFFKLYSGCSDSDKVFLKMIKLQGNQLEYQIILPNCLKK